MTEDRLAKLEKRQRIWTFLMSFLILCLVGVSGYLTYRLHGLETSTSLRVKELRIYDDNGVDRVVIAGALPDPLYKGKPINAPHRSMAGMLIFDETNTERGGYGTMNGYANALLTLDAQGHQVFLMLAEPEGGPFFRAWEGKSSVTFGVSNEPFFNVMKGKEVLLAKPENNDWTTRELR